MHNIVQEPQERNKSVAEMEESKQQNVDVEQFKVGTDLKHEAQTDIHNSTVLAAPVINSKHEVPLSVSGAASVATSSFKQPHSQLQIGMASELSRMSVPLPVGDSSYAQLSTFIPSFQPYPLQQQEIMYYGQGLNIPYPVDNQFSSRFMNFSGISPPNMQNDIQKNRDPKVAVKITHPETKEELKLDELRKEKLDSGPSGTRAYHLNMQLQAHPVAYGHYHLMNYFPYVQPNPLTTFQNPTSVAYPNVQMFPSSMPLGPNNFDMHGAVVSNSGHISSAAIPSKSVVNDNNQAIISRRPLEVGSSQQKQKIKAEVIIKPPRKAVTKPAISSAGSAAEQTLVGKAVSTGKRNLSIESSCFTKNELQNMGTKILEAHQQRQPKTNSFSNNSKSCSSEVCEGPAEVSAALKDLTQSDYPGSTKLDTIDSQDSPCRGVEPPSVPQKTETLDDISNKAKSHRITRNSVTDKDNIGVSGKRRYSRNFLLGFSSLFVELPTDFERRPDTVNSLISGSEALVDHAFGIQDGIQWIKTPFLPAESKQGQQLGVIGGNFSFHSSGGSSTYGRNLHGQIYHHFDGNFLPFPNSTSHGLRRSTWPDADRWQQHSFLQKGLIPLPQSPALQVMHKAKKKYEIRKVTDDEEAKQRQLKAILNKLTPENFDRLFQQVREINIDCPNTLSGLISQIFDKALMEPTFCEMYANFCSHLASELPYFVEGHEKITFKTLLLNKCQEEFVKGEEENGEEKKEVERIHARRRMLGNIRLIGELYKKRMLTERVLYECINKLLGDYQNPDEEDTEALCKLMSTVGEILDHPKSKEKMDSYFEAMRNLSRNAQLSSRMRFMLKDVIDLRNNRWKQRRKLEGPKKIEELHSDAAQERRALVNQRTSSPNYSSSGRKGSTNSGPGTSAFQSGKNSRPKAHGFASQDIRPQDKHLKHGVHSASFPNRFRAEKNAMRYAPVKASE